MRLGNCPQFDIIWKNLSVRHHIEIFAGLKGIPRRKIGVEARSIATAVGLGASNVYEQEAGKMPGGMRRRLSMAMSLIGSPSVILLDEPSTGLDPSTRNSIWSLVNSFATEERSIIITTHMMLGADVLLNRIAIMSKGKLKVVGTQQHLKDRYGSGYLLQLNLIESTPENMERFLSFARRHHQDAILKNKLAKTIRIQLPNDVGIIKVFNALYSPDCLSEGGINQFLLSQSSLEDVFISTNEC